MVITGCTNPNPIFTQTLMFIRCLCGLSPTSTLHLLKPGIAPVADRVAKKYREVIHHEGRYKGIMRRPIAAST